MSDLKGLGPLLSQRLESRNIYTLSDLLDFVDDFVDEDGVPQEELALEFDQWLGEVLVNARPRQCSALRPRLRQGRQYAYRIRDINRNAWDQIVRLLRNWYPPDSLEYAIIPELNDNRAEEDAYPIRCRVRM